MAIGDPITQPIPAVGTSGTTYATEVNAFLTEVKDRLEAEVPRASLEEGDLDLDGFPVQNAEYLGLADAGDAPTTPVGTIQRYNDELYWVSAGGVVQLTAAGQVNVTSASGIGGDYGGVNPAQFRFVDADSEYYAYDDFAGGVWAFLWARGLDLAKDSSSTTRVRLLANSGMGSSYNLTLPTALPSEDTLLQVNSSGAVSAGRRTKTIFLSPSAWACTDGITEVVDQWTMNFLGTSASSYWVNQISTPMNVGNGIRLFAPLELEAGAIITAMNFYTDKGSDSTNTLFAALEEVDPVTGVPTSLATANNTSNGGGPATVAFTSTLPVTIAADKYYRVEMGISDDTPSAVDKIFALSVTYTVAL